MMTVDLPTGERQLSTTQVGGVPNRSAIQEQRGLPIDMRRMMGLEVAAEMVGKKDLLATMDLTGRSLNQKIAGERGTSDDDILAVVRLLERRASRWLTHAQKLRSTLSHEVSAPLAVPAVAQAAIVIAHCDHVARSAYERIDVGPDASPHLLAHEAKRLALTILSESTNLPVKAQV